MTKRPVRTEMPNQIELSVVGKFRREIWTKFLKGIKEYQLIQAGDKIAVCISGGKDSMLMAMCMKRLQRYSKIPFEVVFLVMNPGYNEINYQKIRENAELLEIPVQVFETGIFDAVAKVDQQIETIIMGMLYGSQVQTMMPKLHSENYEGMQLIRPMYLVREADIIRWKQYNDLQFIQCACRFTENCTMCDNGGGGSKRQEIKALLKQLRAVNPAVDKNIFRSVENVNLQTIISYHRGDEYHHFLDDYDEGRSIRGTKAEETNESDLS